MTTSPTPDSLGGLVAALSTGELALGAYLDRLEATIAAREPSVLALLPEDGRFARLRREAEVLESRFPDPASRPLLYGIPVGVKDIFHVDGFLTRAGSRVPVEELAGVEADVVTDLKAVGALILGKTVTTEFAFFAPGPTRNPHDPARTPGGSSSGSAAAVAAGFCPLSVGTQTIGSISRPASFCGIAGYKPSYERISRAGVIPLSPSLDHIGLFARDVAGLVLAAGVLCTEWGAATVGEQPVVGVPEGPYLESAEEKGLQHFETVCDRLIAGGLSVKRIRAFADFEEIVARQYGIVAAEAAAVHRDWYQRFGDGYHPKTAELIERGLAIDAAQLERDLDGREELRRELGRLMEENGIDLWISPAAAGVAPLGLDSTGDPVMSLPWTQAGLPTLAIPAGTNDGLPHGLQLTAGWWKDEELFAWGAKLEKVLE